MDWFVPILGIALVTGGLVAVNAFLDLEQKARAGEAFTATLDRLSQDQRLSAVLQGIHEGRIAGATQQLDLLLCDDILRTNAELASGNARTQLYVEDVFRRIARVRPKTSERSAAGPAQECVEDQVAAERVLARALAANQSAQAK